MSELYSILRYPDPRLRTVAKPIEQVDARIVAIAEKMLATMYAAKGVGLAATQVDIHERMFVMDVEGGQEPVVLINPEIVWRSPEKVKAPEGCLDLLSKATWWSGTGRCGWNTPIWQANVRPWKPMASKRCASSTRRTTWMAKSSWMPCLP